MGIGCPPETSGDPRGLLLQAYRRTRYLVEDPRTGGILWDLGVGESCPALDAWLEERGLGSWAYLTAWNPGSVLLGDAENRRRQEELRRELRELGMLFLEGEGRGEDGSWAPERSCWVPGIEREQALELATRWGQNAILFGRLGEVAELCWCSGACSGPDSPGA